MLKTAIVGASGYAGGELIRIALSHPGLELARITSRRLAGRAIESAHPHLRGATELTFQPHDAVLDDPDLGCALVALPHGRSAALIDQLPDPLPVIDLGADFRLRDPGQFARFYGGVHRAPSRIGDFCYGLSELFDAEIGRRRRVANPGCFATAVLLGLGPLVRAGVVQGRVVVDAKTGSSGSGAAPTPNTHHPSRDGSFYAYKPFGHQHVPEIEQALADLSPAEPPPVQLQVHSAPMARGIFASIYCRLTDASGAVDVSQIFEATYGSRPLVRLVDGSPNVKWVAYSSFADIGWARSGDQLTVFVAIDNLGKGAASQAIQNLNLILGLPEETGLTSFGGHP